MSKLLYKLGFSLLFLFNSPFVYANQISDLSIEGIYIGDDLLKYMKEQEIIEGMEITKSHFNYLKEPNKYSQVYLFKDFPVYDFVSVFFKTNNSSKYFQTNNKYKILQVRGQLSFIQDFKGCLKKKNQVLKELISTFPGLKKEDISLKHPLDSSGRSIVKGHYLYFDSGDLVKIECNDWEEDFRLENNFSEGFTFTIQKEEISDWMSNY